MFDTVVGLSSILGTGLALVAVILAVGIGTVRWQRFYLRRLRWKTIGKQLQNHNPSLRRRHFLRTVDILLTERLARGDTRVIREVNWLTHLAGATEHECVETYERDVTAPFTFCTTATSFDRHLDYLRGVATAYREYGAAARRRWMLRTAAAPIVADEYGCARAMVELIGKYARLQEMTPTANPLRDECIAVSAAPDGTGQWVRLRAWPEHDTPSRGERFAGVKVSYAPYRVLTSRGGIADQTRPADVIPISVLRPDEIESRTHQHFDGIMTRLHGNPGFRIEADPHSGRQLLHVSLAETSFFAFRLTQWHVNNPCGTRPDHAFQSRLLSVNLLLVDDADRILLVRRADAITHGGLFAGAVTGAIEVVAREGITADLDDYGLPDPMAAITREAREELGLDISRPQNKLGVIGLIEVMTPRDMHTHVLTATARIEAATDFHVDAGKADDIEGTWEVGNEAMVIDLPHVLSSPTTLQDFVAWLRTSPELLPHAVGGILLILRARLEPTTGGKRRAAAGATDELIRAGLTAPTPPVATQRPLSVTVQALRTQ